MTDPLPPKAELSAPEAEPNGLIIGIFDPESVETAMRETGYTGAEHMRLMVAHARNDHDPQTSLAGLRLLSQHARTVLQLSGQEQTENYKRVNNKDGATEQLEASRRVIKNLANRPATGIPPGVTTYESQLDQDDAGADA